MKIGDVVKCHGCAGAGTQQGFRCDVCRGLGYLAYHLVPNLDAATDAELLTFIDTWHGADEDKAYELVGPRAHREVHVKRLVAYARCTVRARDARVRGDIQEALRWEHRAERCFHRIPMDLSW